MGALSTDCEVNIIPENANEGATHNNSHKKSFPVCPKACSNNLWCIFTVFLSSSSSGHHRLPVTILSRLDCIHQSTNTKMQFTIHSCQWTDCWFEKNIYIHCRPGARTHNNVPRTPVRYRLSSVSDGNRKRLVGRRSKMPNLAAFPLDSRQHYGVQHGFSFHAPMRMHPTAFNAVVCGLACH